MFSRSRAWIGMRRRDGSNRVIGLRVSLYYRVLDRLTESIERVSLYYRVVDRLTESIERDSRPLLPAFTLNERSIAAYEHATTHPGTAAVATAIAEAVGPSVEKFAPG